MSETFSLNDLAKNLHDDMKKYWFDEDGNKKNRNKGELIALMHSELSELLDAERNNLMDDKLPHRKGAEVEAADAIMRILDYSAAYGFDLDSTIKEKREFNRKRKDQKIEAKNGNGLS